MINNSNEFSSFFIFNDPVDIVLSLDEQFEDEIYDCMKEMVLNAPSFTESTIMEEAESDDWAYNISLDQEDYVYDYLLDGEVENYVGSVNNIEHMDYGQMIDIISGFEDK